MKKIIFLLFLSTLFAEEPSKSIWDYHPIHIGGNLIKVGNAAIKRRKESYDDGKLSFNKANAFIYCFIPLNQCNFFLPRVEYNTFEMNWNHNSRFDKTRFQFMQFTLTFLSSELETWRWIARADYNIDIDHFFCARTYALFSALIWGTHELHRKWHYHIGAFGYTGFEGQEIYPIIGIDFSPNQKWMFQLIFPMSYSIDYRFNKKWRLSLKARPLKERFRVGSAEPDPKAIFNYSTIGTELNLHYEKFLNFEFELFAGYNFGGNFYIKNQKGHRPLYTSVQAAPYGGVSLNWGI